MLKSFCILVALALLATVGECANRSELVPTTIYRFSGPDGALPRSQLIQASDGLFYGTTWQGGTFNTGTVFKITPAGTLTTIYNFTGGADGGSPRAGVIQGSDGLFYGTAWPQQTQCKYACR